MKIVYVYHLRRSLKACSEDEERVAFGFGSNGFSEKNRKKKRAIRVARPKTTDVLNGIFIRVVANRVFFMAGLPSALVLV